MESTCTIALLGQPNAGKSTLFNGLTGARQHVGNWPGKTVEQKEGYFKKEGVSYTVVDLSRSFFADSLFISAIFIKFIRINFNFSNIIFGVIIYCLI